MYNNNFLTLVMKKIRFIVYMMTVTTSPLNRYLTFVTFFSVFIFITFPYYTNNFFYSYICWKKRQKQFSL